MDKPHPKLTFASCPHQGDEQKSGIALVSIGNILRCDDGIGVRLLDKLSPDVKDEVCLFKLETYSQFVLDCVAYHEVAVIVDAVRSGKQVGDVSIIDLKEMFEYDAKLELNSCHGFSFYDELRLITDKSLLPDKMYFFGIEIDKVEWGEDLSKALSMRQDEINKRLEDFLKSLFLKLGV
ncbi:MAG: hydrogenase maturation protease [Candidatus Melainabacteria bacterium]|nr:hydrogenase maturation protease [Candidatus Melainabacteria bacterium]